MRVLYYKNMMETGVIDRGKWKIVADTPDEQWQLFDMESDPTELQDLNSEFEDVVKTLTADYQRWTREVGVRKVN